MPKNLGGQVTVAKPPFGKIFGGHVRTVPGNTCVKLEVRSFNRFGAIGILRPKIYGVTWPWPRPLLGKFLGVLSGLSLGTRESNLKSVPLTVLELLAFNFQKFRGSRDRGHAPFGKIFGDHVRTVPWNTCVKFQVRSFNCFGAIGI